MSGMIILDNLYLLMSVTESLMTEAFLHPHGQSNLIRMELPTGVCSQRDTSRRCCEVKTVTYFLQKRGQP